MCHKAIINGPDRWCSRVLPVFHPHPIRFHTYNQDGAGGGCLSQHKYAVTLSSAEIIRETR